MHMVQYKYVHAIERIKKYYIIVYKTSEMQG